MILVSCVENRDGLRFNGRRCSRDREMCRDLLERSKGKLWLSKESRILFKEFPQAVLHVVEDPAETPPGEYCFWEAPARDTQPEELLLYRWNRDYPWDEGFCFPQGLWIKTAQREFPGCSHPVITAERYGRGD